MASKSPKAQLEELYSINHALNRPCYQTERVGGADNAPLFRCTVACPPLGDAVDVSGGGEGTSKRRAEQLAAREALGALRAIASGSHVAWPQESLPEEGF
jgi:dsRNA-specific ribonuclease